MMSKKAQTWSIDMLIAVSIFVIVFAVFLGIMTNVFERNIDSRLKEEGQIVAGKITNEWMDGNKINEEQIFFIANNTNYTQLKQTLGLKNDFCIFIEDMDGNLVPIGNISGEYFYGIGNNEASLAGFDCGEIVT